MELTKLLSFLAVVLPVAYGAPTETASTLHPDILQAMQRDFGLTAEQASARVADDLHASEVIEQLRGTMGDSFAGAWIDKGKAFVGITDQAKAEEITAKGATPVVMNTSHSKLKEAKIALDNVFLGKAGSKRSVATSGIASYFVDVASNKLVIEALSGSHAEAEQLASQAGLSASEFEVKTIKSMPVTVATVQGGDAYDIDGQFRCSVGFSVNGGFVSAGHCGQKGSSVTTAGGGAALGTFAGSVFPGDADMSYIKTVSGTTLTGYVNGYGHSAYPIKGHTEAAVGASICRSGTTTGLRCGTIQSKDNTVNYGSDGTVTGLTKTSCCADHGDSGGSFFAGTQAQGVTSGGTVGCDPGSGPMYFQPVNEILSTYGLTLVTA